MHRKLEERFEKAKDVVMFHVQTVFEGEHTNTPERGPLEAKKYRIDVPVGYDAHVDGAYTSLIMQQYGTGGTPWTIVIDKKGIVRHNAVTPTDVEGFADLIERLRKEEE